MKEKLGKTRERKQVKEGMEDENEEEMVKEKSNVGTKVRTKK